MFIEFGLLYTPSSLLAHILFLSLLTCRDRVIMGDNSVVYDKKVEDFAEKPVNQVTNVFVWDMDETLILLKSLLNGAYAKAFNGEKDEQKGVEIGRTWENRILELSDELFFYEEIENYNKPYLDALKEYDDGRDLSDYDFGKDGFGPPYDDDANRRKLAYRHRVIANKYKQGLHNVLDQDKKKMWNELYDLTDEYTDRWLSSGIM
ncbi:hypothetical protein Tsubulata_009346 [Turnera subulata]|uniref:protein-tyrosine-phosphatase n=1 Tax=Turnera subulata TaxID=218843 RepID=A0A9Q0GGL4_9ROSI|nr:hypothetical protein Tsubulata_009346 [Turnera subulata]